ncbi:glycosyltransferase family 4 protein [Steroidobacter sp.]|uniref:glycosyltransferase family 4 protein n=1 Tax=Steroidobacter sp. TaxID=1978227 RepID=UPI001A549DFD|nr:glycosyltransferase family 4 protein [Steroidobacter sp.]MBL8267853.1 glycosyltransferase family 4 protein [Steroidobacter sp.]
MSSIEIATDVLIIDGEGKGGMAHYARNLADGLARHCRTQLYTLGPYDGLPKGSLLGAALDRSTKGRVIRRNYNPFRSARLARELRERYRPAVVHIVSRVGAFRGLIQEFGRLGVNVVATVHDPSPHAELRTWWGRVHTIVYDTCLMPWLLRRAAALHVHSRDHAGALVERYGVDSERVYVVQHGVGLTERIATGNACPLELAQLDAGDHTALFFGRIEPYKGLDLLFSAAREVLQSLPTLRLLIAGAGTVPPIPDDIRHRVVLINRFVADEEIRAIFAASRFVVLPYAAATQTGVIPLAAAFGKPAIATRVGALPELIVDGQTGLVVPPQSPTALAQAMLSLSVDAVGTARQGKQARAHLEQKYGWRQITAAHLREYDARFGTTLVSSRVWA